MTEQTQAELMSELPWASHGVVLQYEYSKSVEIF